MSHCMGGLGFLAQQSQKIMDLEKENRELRERVEKNHAVHCEQFDRIFALVSENQELQALIEAKDETLKQIQDYDNPHHDEWRLFAEDIILSALALTPDALKQKIAARDAVIEAAKFASRILDDIKYELYARVYTVIDDEFESVFLARDSIDLALNALKESEK
jgi:hypothetical protein